MLGEDPRINAAAPATCGQAMDVPLFEVLPVSELADADTTLLPGAQIFTHRPKLLKDDL